MVANVSSKKAYFFIFVIIFFNLNIYLKSENKKHNIVKLIPVLADTAPVIDGKLDDKMWKNEASVDDSFITYNPTYGKIFPQKTKVWLAYDKDNLYFAFYCYDTEPDKIKTSITKRDNSWGDDWVGVALDPIGNKQSLYQFYVNPNGMQGDLLETPANGDNLAPDWVWYSGGKIVKDGYTTEIKIPLKSIRFKHGENISINILLLRRLSRLDMIGTWPEMPPGKGSFNSTTEVVYKKLSKQLLLEFIPSVTFGSLWDRESPEKWTKGDSDLNAGISMKYGITSTITAEMTVNPDFSQVESDSFQISRNIRYPIFYREKRPFFMEAGDLFELAGSNSNLYPTVHTRKIVDPSWGGRITGDVGKFTFGTMIASDKWVGRDLEDESNFYLGKEALYTIGRVKYSFNGDNYIGALYTGKELGDYYNRVFAMDTKFRFGESHSVVANFYNTNTNDPETSDKYKGVSYTGKYTYSAKNFYGSFSIERYGENFQMDTAFYRRTNIFYSELQLNPIYSIKSPKFKWLQAIRPVFLTTYLYDYSTGMSDKYLKIGVAFSFIKQGNLTLAWDIVQDEAWAGETFDTSGFWGGGGIQITKWLKLNLSLRMQNRIYYDNENPFQGNRFYISPSLNIQPISTLSFYLSYEYTDFNKKKDGSDVYDYHILYTRATYQPSKHLYFRFLVQYDSYLDTVLSDVLASYELVPGTVFHVGYGSMHENTAWDPRNRNWSNDLNSRKYYQTSQSFFIKCSYRLQL